jgi:hypothetical protein
MLSSLSANRSTNLTAATIAETLTGIQPHPPQRINIQCQVKHKDLLQTNIIISAKPDQFSLLQSTFLRLQHLCSLSTPISRTQHDYANTIPLFNPNERTPYKYLQHHSLLLPTTHRTKSNRHPNPSHQPKSSHHAIHHHPPRPPNPRRHSPRRLRSRLERPSQSLGHLARAREAQRPLHSHDRSGSLQPGQRRRLRLRLFRARPRRCAARYLQLPAGHAAQDGDLQG